LPYFINRFENTEKIICVLCGSQILVANSGGNMGAFNGVDLAA